MKIKIINTLLDLCIDIFKGCKIKKKKKDAKDKDVPDK